MDDQEQAYTLEKPKCRYGIKCYRTNPTHTEKYSHPQLELGDGLEIKMKTKLSIREKEKTTTKTTKITIKGDKEPAAVIRLPPDITVYAVIGKNFANVATIKTQTGARSVLVGNAGNQKINLFGSSKQVKDASECWHKLIAVAPKQRVIEKIYPKTDVSVQFYPAPEGIRILKRYEDPQILMLLGHMESGAEPVELKTITTKQLQRLTNYIGNIKLHAKFGKNVWYSVPDSLQESRPANQMFKAIRDLPVKSFFSMGIADENLLGETLDFRKQKESFNLKLVVNQGGLYESVLITVLVKDGMLRFSKAQMHEEKHITDQICLDKDVDIRLSLENTVRITPDSPLLATVCQYAQALELKQDNNGNNTIVLPTLPDVHVQVYRIQHKKRNSYIYEEAFNIDVVNVRVFEIEDKLIDSKYKLPHKIPWEITPTEVEVSSQKWKRMFKFNKPNKSSHHNAWTAEGIIAGFPQFIKVVHDVAALLKNAANKNK